MIEKNQRKDLRKLIPHGCLKLVSDKAGVTYKAVNDYFNGDSNSYKIENAVLEVIAQIKDSKKILLEKAYA